MASSLPDLANHLAKGIYKVKWKDCSCFLEYDSVNNNLIKNKCSFYNKNYSNKIDKK